MDSTRSRARSVAADLTSAWLGGDYDAVAGTCTPDVHWWTPATDGTADGPADASAALQQVLAPLRQPLALTAIVPSDDGTRCVVELRSAPTAQQTPPAFVTSVLTLRDGKISAGRTYTDLRGHVGHPGPVAS